MSFENYLMILKSSINYGVKVLNNPHDQVFNMVLALHMVFVTKKKEFKRLCPPILFVMIEIPII